MPPSLLPYVTTSLGGAALGVALCRAMAALTERSDRRMLALPADDPGRAQWAVRVGEQCQRGTVSPAVADEMASAGLLSAPDAASARAAEPIYRMRPTSCRVRYATLLLLSCAVCAAGLLSGSLAACAACSLCVSLAALDLWWRRIALTPCLAILAVSGCLQPGMSPLPVLMLALPVLLVLLLLGRALGPGSFGEGDAWLFASLAPLVAGCGTAATMAALAALVLELLVAMCLMRFRGLGGEVPMAPFVVLPVSLAVALGW